MIFTGRYCYLEPLVALKHLDDLWEKVGKYKVFGHTFQWAVLQLNKNSLNFYKSAKIIF